ncbi:MAG: hypothetical protein H6606_00135 [Flavobacteriales bacterium]|nr:hypothetical protein [Flavobacteriales bacterium]
MTDSSLVFEQIQHIARGIAYNTNNQLFVTSIYSVVLDANYEFDLNQQIADMLFTNPTSIDYDAVVSLEIDDNYPDNNYDEDYFFGFTWDSCEYDIGVFIPDVASINPLLNVIVVPADPFTDPADSVIGYFLDSSGFLDSTFVTEDDFGNEFIWVVTSFNKCEGGFDDIRSGELYKAEICNGNDICEGNLGENFGNCDDCADTDLNKNSLFLIDIESLTDRKNSGSRPSDHYQEHWLSFKYDIAFQYLHLARNFPTPNGNHRLLGGRMVKDLTLTSHQDMNTQVALVGISLLPSGNSGQSSVLVDHESEAVLKKFKRKEIKRHNGTNTQGNHTTVSIGQKLAINYSPSNDIVVFFFYERDEVSASDTVHIPFDFDVQSVGNQVHTAFAFRGKRAPYSQLLGSPNRFIVIDEDSDWQPGTVDGDPNGQIFETVLDGEFKIRFGHRPN